MMIPQQIFLTDALTQNQSLQGKYHSLKSEIMLQKKNQNSFMRL